MARDQSEESERKRAREEKEGGACGEASMTRCWEELSVLGERERERGDGEKDR